MKKVLLAAFLCVAWAANANALVDVSSKVQVIRSAPGYNYVTKQSYVDVSLRNISSGSLEFPLRYVISGVSGTGVSLFQPEGNDKTGRPYYLFSSQTLSTLSPGATVGPKRIYFDNPNRGRFSFSALIFNSTPQETIGNVTLSLQVGDIPSVITNFQDDVKDKYLNAFQSIPESEWNTLINELQGAVLLESNGVEAKYGIIRNENGRDILYEIIMRKDSKGIWRIKDL